jgi:EAL domain-containing protein (putative c-di-GMP-specific phosphodiesterase class I)
VRAVDQDPRSLNVIKTVLDLCQNLNLSCVVEGVETEAQYQMIKELGCDRMQGFLTSPPLEVEKIGEYLSREAGRQRQASRGFAA